MGIGVLYGKYNLLNKLSPFLMGGDMIEYVYEQETTFAKPPTKFEAGTQNIGGAVGLASAIEYLENKKALPDHSNGLSFRAHLASQESPYHRPDNTSLY